MTPAELFKYQTRDIRSKERQWQQTRELIAIHTKKRGNEIMPLSIDDQGTPETIIDKDLAQKIKEKLN